MHLLHYSLSMNCAIYKKRWVINQIGIFGYRKKHSLMAQCKEFRRKLLYVTLTNEVCLRFVDLSSIALLPGL